MTLRFDLKNTLQIPLQLTDIIPECMFYRIRVSPHDVSFTVSDQASITSDQIREKLKRINGVDYIAFEEYDVEYMQHVALEPNSRYTVGRLSIALVCWKGWLTVCQVRIRFIPRQQGYLRIKGIHHNVADLVHGFIPMKKRGKRLHATKEHLQNVMYAPDEMFDIFVSPMMPLLDVTFREFPSELLSGQCCHAILQIHNKGERGMTDIRIITSQPSTVYVVSQALPESTIASRGNFGGLQSVFSRYTAI